MNSDTHFDSVIARWAATRRHPLSDVRRRLPARP
jgi:hypothetical protein